MLSVFFWCSLGAPPSGYKNSVLLHSLSSRSISDHSWETKIITNLFDVPLRSSVRRSGAAQPKNNKQNNKPVLSRTNWKTKCVNCEVDWNVLVIAHLDISLRCLIPVPHLDASSFRLQLAANLILVLHWGTVLLVRSVPSVRLFLLFVCRFFDSSVRFSHLIPPNREVARLIWKASRAAISCGLHEISRNGPFASCGLHLLRWSGCLYKCQCTDSVLPSIQSNSAAKNLHCKSYCFAICSIGFGLTTGQLSISRTLEHPRGKLDQNTLFVRKYENNEQSAIICRQKAPAMKAGSIIAASESVLRLESVLLPSWFLS